jgi:hypothetical protein
MPSITPAGKPTWSALTTCPHGRTGRAFCTVSGSAGLVNLEARDVMDLYMKKLQVNQDRQDSNYSMADKTEQDNKGITLSREE